MESVKNFLLDYYIWVLAVLAILLVTVIGFLADTKKKKKMKEKVMMEQNNQVDVNDSVSQSNITSNNVNFEAVSNEGNPNSNNLVDAGVNIDNGMNNAMGESFFVPASEQKPVIEPVNVNMPLPPQYGTANDYNQNSGVSQVSSFPGPSNNVINNINDNVNPNSMGNNMLEVNNLDNSVMPIETVSLNQTPVVNMDNVLNQNVSGMVNNIPMNQPINNAMQGMNQPVNEPMISGMPNESLNQVPVVNMDRISNQGLNNMGGSIPTTSPIGINYQGASNFINNGPVVNPIPPVENNNQVNNPVPVVPTTPTNNINPVPIMNGNVINSTEPYFPNNMNNGMVNNQQPNNIMPGPNPNNIENLPNQFNGPFGNQ